MTTTITVGALCSVLLALGTSLANSKNYTVADPGPYTSLNRLALRLHEIGRSILNPKALTFLRENAPAYAIGSYRARQQQLAQLSLRLASKTISHSIAGASSFYSLSLQRPA